MSGDSWFSAVGRPLYNNQHYYAVAVLVFYFFFTSMGVLNIITGIFVEQTVEAAQMDAEVVKERVLHEQDKNLRLIFSSFMELDGDGNQLLSFDEFSVMMETEGIMERF